jgi:hypothetical protein
MLDREKIIKRLLGSIRRESQLLILILVAGAAFAYLFFGFERFAPQNTIDVVETALQFLSGNWPNTPIEHNSFLFALGVMFRIMLVTGAASGAWFAYMKLRDMLEVETMKLTKILADRDRMIETELLQIFSGELQTSYRDHIHKAVQVGAEQWENEILPVLVGETEAKRIRERLHSVEL